MSSRIVDQSELFRTVRGAKDKLFLLGHLRSIVEVRSKILNGHQASIVGPAFGLCVDPRPRVTIPVVDGLKGRPMAGGTSGENIIRTSEAGSLFIGR